MYVDGLYLPNYIMFLVSRLIFKVNSIDPD